MSAMMTSLIIIDNGCIYANLSHSKFASDGDACMHFESWKWYIFADNLIVSFNQWQIPNSHILSFLPICGSLGLSQHCMECLNIIPTPKFALLPGQMVCGPLAKESDLQEASLSEDACPIMLLYEFCESHWNEQMSIGGRNGKQAFSDGQTESNDGTNSEEGLPRNLRRLIVVPSTLGHWRPYKNKRLDHMKHRRYY
jgi:hypothetical protein